MILPTLFLVGATHRTAPFSFREKLALGAEGEATLAAELRRVNSLQEFVILNTCNRVEIYGVANNPQAERSAAAAFCGLRHVESAEFERFGFRFSGEQAVEHLLSVSAGLDSQIVGETEIFGQVKRAYATAQTRGSAGPILNRLFQKAFQAAKHVRTHTGVSTGQVSIANIAVDLAQTVFGGLSESRILLLGVGEMGEKSARAFQSRGAAHVTVANRHRERADVLAAGLGADVISFENRDDCLSNYDVIVCSTSAPGTVLSRDAVGRAMEKRRGRPALFIDLAMPRDVEAGVADLANVFLYNLDDLAEVAAKNRQARRAEADAGRLALVTRTSVIWSVLQLQFATLAAEPSRAAPQRSIATGASLGVPVL